LLSRGCRGGSRQSRQGTRVACGMRTVPRVQGCTDPTPGRQMTRSASVAR
jgi:hypothetical protein